MNGRTSRAEPRLEAVMETSPLTAPDMRGR